MMYCILKFSNCCILQIDYSVLKLFIGFAIAALAFYLARWVFVRLQADFAEEL